MTAFFSFKHKFELEVDILFFKYRLAAFKNLSRFFGSILNHAAS